MSNEEKILAMLTKMQGDIDSLRIEVEAIRNNEILKAAEKSKPKHDTYEALKAMSELLTQEEKDALGKYMEEEEARKAALYG